MANNYNFLPTEISQGAYHCSPSQGLGFHQGPGNTAKKVVEKTRPYQTPGHQGRHLPLPQADHLTTIVLSFLLMVADICLGNFQF